MLHINKLTLVFFFFWKKKTCKTESHQSYNLPNNYYIIEFQINQTFLRTTLNQKTILDNFQV